VTDFDAFLHSLAGAQEWKDELDLGAFRRCTAGEQADGVRRVVAELERGDDERLPRALALMSDFATVAPALARAVGSARPAVRAQAARTLRNLVDELSTGGLGECLSSSAPDRAAAAAALGETPGVLAAQILADHLDDAEVGEASQKALANRFLALVSDGTTEQLRRLGAALHSSDSVRRATAIDGLRKLAQLGGPGAAATLGERFLPDWLK
jgi:hypothetical protein